MKHNLFAFGLISVLAVLLNPHASLAQDLPAFHNVNPVGPSDASPVAAAIKSRIEAWGNSDVKDLARERTGVWHAHVLRNKVEIAVSVDKGGRIIAQAADQPLAARCGQLYGIASRTVSGGAGAEGSLAPNMGVMSAGLDCQKGRYDEGIKALEKILNDHNVSYPPG